MIPLPTRSVLLLTAVLAACGGERTGVVAVGMTGYAPDALAVLRDAEGGAEGLEIRWELMDPEHHDRIQRPELDAVVTWFQEVIERWRPAVVVGPRGSRATLVVSPVFEEAGIPLISPDATSDALLGSGPNLFRLLPLNRDQGSFMARFAVDRLEARTASIFYVTDEYGTDLRDGIESDFAARGGAVMDAVPLGGEAEGMSNDYAALVEQTLLRGEPDVIFLACGPKEAAAIAREVIGRRPDVVFVAGDGMFDDPYLLSAAPEAAGRFYRVGFWHASLHEPVSRDYLTRFRRIVGREPGDVDALAYDGLLVASRAIREVGADPDRIRGYLASLGAERPAIEGVSGPIAFAGGGRRSLLMVALGPDSIVARITP